MNAKVELLDEILERAGGLYISDLHDKLMKSGVKRAVGEIKTGVYSDREWQEAYAYISGEKITAGTEQEIRERFKQIT